MPTLEAGDVNLMACLDSPQIGQLICAGDATSGVVALSLATTRLFGGLESGRLTKFTAPADVRW